MNLQLNIPNTKSNGVLRHSVCAMQNDCYRPKIFL